MSLLLSHSKSVDRNSSGIGGGSGITRKHMGWGLVIGISNCQIRPRARMKSTEEAAEGGLKRNN